MEQEEPEKLSVAKCERADSLAQAKRVHFGSIWRFQALDCLPMEAEVTIKSAPVEFPQAAQRGDHLLQFSGLEAKQDLLKFGAIEIEANPAMCGGHARAPPFSLSPVSETYRGRLLRTRLCCPGQSSLNPGAIRLIEGPELAFGDHLHRRENNPSIVEPLNTQHFAGVTLFQRSLPTSADRLNLTPGPCRCDCAQAGSRRCPRLGRQAIYAPSCDHSLQHHGGYGGGFVQRAIPSA